MEEEEEGVENKLGEKTETNTRRREVTLQL